MGFKWEFSCFADAMPSIEPWAMLELNIVSACFPRFGCNWWFPGRHPSLICLEFQEPKSSMLVILCQRVCFFCWFSSWKCWQLSFEWNVKLQQRKPWWIVVVVPLVADGNLNVCWIRALSFKGRRGHVINREALDWWKPCAMVSVGTLLLIRTPAVLLASVHSPF